VVLCFSSEELVAIKIVDIRQFQNITDIERIQEEIRILESIKHKNIVNLVEV
jgi:serine/threonine protein kinase